jgi:hypothetical protein
MTAQSDGESCLHVGFVEAGECSAGIRWLHLRHGNVPAMFESKSISTLSPIKEMGELIGWVERG